LAALPNLLPKDLLAPFKKAPVDLANLVKNNSDNSVLGMKRMWRFGSVQTAAFELNISSSGNPAAMKPGQIPIHKHKIPNKIKND